MKSFNQTMLDSSLRPKRIISTCGKLALHTTPLNIEDFLVLVENHGGEHEKWVSENFIVSIQNFFRETFLSLIFLSLFLYILYFHPIEKQTERHSNEMQVTHPLQTTRLPHLDSAND